MRLISPTLLALFILTFTLTKAIAGPDGWQKLFQELRSHPQVIYVDTRMPFSPGGFIVTNELGHQSFDIPTETPADVHLGFGTTVNLSLAYARKAKSLIFADISQDVALAHIGLFRPLFLISESPEEFLGRAASVEYSDASLDQIAERVLKMRFSQSVLSSTAKELEKLVDEGRISMAAATFCINALAGQDPRHPSNTWFAPLAGGASFPFRDAHHGGLFPALLVMHHHWGSLGKAALQDGLRLPRSFQDAFMRADILSGEGYRYIRNLYLNNQVYVVVASMFDPIMWQKVAEFVGKKQQRITDIYGTNVVDLAGGRKARKALLQLASLSSSQFNLYTVTGYSPRTFKFKSEQVTAEPAGCDATGLLGGLYQKTLGRLKQAQ